MFYGNNQLTNSASDKEPVVLTLVNVANKEYLSIGPVQNKIIYPTMASLY